MCVAPAAAEQRQHRRRTQGAKEFGVGWRADEFGVGCVGVRSAIDRAEDGGHQCEVHSGKGKRRVKLGKLLARRKERNALGAGIGGGTR